ncbi:DUF7284 family protein [Halomarina ordinaria]|uniref:DUF541 domain-containing protein n=1 Tax=Halomarina ordinaria TaxID=3033939 RepID=A0ABD5U821_9EURY|nr:hypothetical protein [Halomarina sp. PSRA2]
MRGQSTVVDGTLALVVVSATVGLLLTAPAPASTDSRATETATALQTATVTVEADGRTHHGTPAALLAHGAVARVTLADEALAASYHPSRDALTRATDRVARHRASGVRVRAVWEPYPDAPLSGRVAVGERPPPSGSVDAAVTTLPAPDVGRMRPPNATYDALGATVARATVRFVVPPALVERAAYDEGARTALDTRLARVEGALADFETDGEDGRAAPPDVAVDRLESRLGERVAADLRERYDSPRAARDALSVRDVTLVVRTWSR